MLSSWKDSRDRNDLISKSTGGGIAQSDHLFGMIHVNMHAEMRVSRFPYLI